MSSPPCQQRSPLQDGSSPPQSSSSGSSSNRHQHLDALHACPFLYFHTSALPTLLSTFSTRRRPPAPLPTSLAHLLSLLPPHTLIAHPKYPSIYSLSSRISAIQSQEDHTDTEIHHRVQWLAAPANYGGVGVLMDLYHHAYGHTLGDRDATLVHMQQVRVAIVASIGPGTAVVPACMWDAARVKALEDGLARVDLTDREIGWLELPGDVRTRVSVRKVILACLARRQPLGRGSSVLGDEQVDQTVDPGVGLVSTSAGRPTALDCMQETESVNVDNKYTLHEG